jgi:tRNA1(Val) A37 N6-methylase TrmN6
MRIDVDSSPAPQWSGGIFRFGDIWIGNPPYRPDTRRRQRKPKLASVAKQASKAGIEVARYEIRPDGSIVIVTDKGESTEASNPWLAEAERLTKQ